MEQKYVERFWGYVDKNGPNGCWLWTGGRDRKAGYGKFHVGGRVAPRTLNAHRVAWELTHGPIPDGLCALHRCDVPSCVNAEEHLFLGTKADNNEDMVAKGRQYTGPKGKFNLDRAKSTSGEKNFMFGKPELAHHRKLTADQVVSLRLERAAGAAYATLMAKYGICKSNVEAIVNRRTWVTV